MKKELTDLKKAINEIATKLSVEIYELHMEENTEVDRDFGKKYAPIALEIYKELLYSGVDLRISFISAVSRSRACDCKVDEIGFWEDLSIIVSLYEALEEHGYYAEKNGEVFSLLSCIGLEPNIDCS